MSDLSLGEGVTSVVVVLVMGPVCGACALPLCGYPKFKVTVGSVECMHDWSPVNGRAGHPHRFSLGRS